MKDNENNEFLPDLILVNYGLMMYLTIQKIIWKYLQLILFNIIGNTQDKNIGDVVKLLHIDGDLLKEKMQETMKGLHEMFSNNDENEEDEEKDEENDNKKPDFLIRKYPRKYI